MSDHDLDLLRPIALAALRLSIVTLSAQFQSGQLTPGQRQEAVTALDELEAQLLPVARNADTAHAALAGLRDLADRLSGAV